MPSYLILSQSEIGAAALNAWLEIFVNEPLDEESPALITWKLPSQLSSDPSSQRQQMVTAYETLARRIDSVCREKGLLGEGEELVTLVDCVDPFALSAISDEADWNTLIAMLILTFPEITWIFGVANLSTARSEGRKSEWEKIYSSHRLKAGPEAATRPALFDPTGLRDWVRQRTNEALERLNDGLLLRIRPEGRLAAAIEEEKAYAFLHAYVAYRFGCRADVVTNLSLMTQLFGKDDHIPHGYWLILEDMCLRFPDGKGGSNLVCLKERSKMFKKLNSANERIECSQHRILITAGEATHSDQILADNLAYLNEKKQGSGFYIPKPLGGMFDLWDRIGFMAFFRGDKKGDVEYRYHPLEGMEGSLGHHGAPGKLMLIADKLLRRTDAISSKPNSVLQAVLGAVFACDALELTDGRTPTTAIEALSLQHKFESAAECLFSGVEHNILIKPRLREITTETERLSRFFSSSRKTAAALNANIHVVNHLVQVFRDFNQFDEEHACAIQARKLTNKLCRHNNRPHGFLFFPVMWYFEQLFTSMSRFVAGMTFWIGVLTVSFYIVGNHPTMLFGFFDAVTSFLAPGTPLHPSGSVDVEKANGAFVLVASLSIFLGFIHIGVFTAYLYSMFLKR